MVNYSQISLLTILAQDEALYDSIREFQNGHKTGINQEKTLEVMIGG